MEAATALSTKPPRRSPESTPAPMPISASMATASSASLMVTGQALAS